MLGPTLLRSLLEVQGGFTLEWRSGAPVRAGLSVCLDPHLSLAVPHARWHDEVVGGWLARHTVELGRAGRYLGGWLDPASALVCLDVVRVVPRWLRRPALAAGRARGQRFAFDLTDRQLVAVRSRA